MRIDIKTPEQKKVEEMIGALAVIYAKLDPDDRKEVFNYAAYKYAQSEMEREG